MNFDDILGKLLPLFERKMALMDRALSLEEKKEANKTDLEYRKLESQIKSDKDKIKWEQEKLITTIAGNKDIQKLQNAGLLDVQKAKGADEFRLQEAKIAGERLIGQDKNAALTYESNMKALPEMLKVGAGQRIKNADGSETITEGNKQAQGMAATLAQRTGLVPATQTATGRNVAGEAEVAADVLRQHEKNGTPDSARNYLNALPTDTRQAALALLNPAGGTATLATGVAPATPAPGVRTPIPVVQPAASAVEPVRPIVQPTVTAPAPLQEKSFAAAGPLGGNGKTAFGGTPGGILGQAWERGGMQVADILKRRKEEEEARRKARGLNIGGSF